jgi:arginine exporter protein ArgO
MPATAGTFGGGALPRQRALFMKVPAFAGMTLLGWGGALPWRRALSMKVPACAGMTREGERGAGAKALILNE